LKRIQPDQVYDRDTRTIGRMARFAAESVGLGQKRPRGRGSSLGQ